MATPAPQRRTFGTIRRLPSGRYQASYIGPDLQRHGAPITFAAKDGAVAWVRTEQRLIEDAHNGGSRWTPPAHRAELKRRLEELGLFGVYARRWILERRNSHGEPLRALTIKDYQQVLDDYLMPTFGDRPLADISRADIRAWYATLDPKKPRARTKAYGLLRAIMNSAVDDELATTSPVHIRGAGAASRRRHLEPATPRELGVIINSMPERLRAAVAISAWCALRYGELAELRRKDVDLKNGSIKVRRAVVFLKGTVTVGPTKSDAGVRDVAIPPHVVPLIESHLELHVKSAPDALLFPADGGGHMWHSVMGGHYKKARKAAGRPDLRWHDLRHTGATLAAQAGATLAELQARLGHSTAAAAHLYQHAAKDRDRLIADRLSQLNADETSD